MSSAAAGKNDEARRMQEQAREMERQAEAQRREAERNARRMEAEARRQQREAEQRQREAARQAREAERSAKSSVQTPKSETSSRPATTRTEPSKQDDKTKSSDNKGDSRKDKVKNDGKSEDKDKENDKDKDEADTAETEIDSGPPATVEQWLKRLGSPKKTATETPQTAPSPSKDKTDREPAKIKVEKDRPKTGDAATTKADSPPSPAKPIADKTTTKKDHRPPPPIVFPDFRPEVLAVNATPQVIDTAKSLGFATTSSTTLGNLSLTVTRLAVPSGMSPADAQALLSRAMPKSNFAPNQKYRIYRTAGTSSAQPAGVRAAVPGAATPQTCDAERCFGRDAIGWNPALSSCASGVKIGVIDTSVDLGHPAFGKKKPALKHLGRGGTPGPDWHGTGVTALLAGDASGGTPGLIPDAAFFVADIFYADDDNEPASDTVSMLRAFDWLDSKGVKIINMSLSGPPDELIRKAVEKLAAKGVIFIAAAGNEGPAAGPSYPAAYDQVIAVTAVTKDLQNYRYANRGSYIDFAAPGVAIYTALPGAMEGYHSGTSFATPYVTAALAAIYAQLPNKTHGEAMRHFKYRDLGTPGPDPIFGLGLVMAPSSCGGNEMVSAPGSSTAEPAKLVRTANPPPHADTSELPWLGLRPSGD